MPSKRCGFCKVEKEISMFHAKKYGKFGVDGRCKECRNKIRENYRTPEDVREYARRWRLANPRKYLNNVLRTKLKINVEVFEKMFKEQNGACAICNKQNLDGTRLAVDHNHITGEIRGLLCSRCNRGIGFLDDSIERLHIAADYLEGNKALRR